MGRHLRPTLLIATIGWSFISCQTASQQSGAPTPEQDQVISETLKDLYMAASLAPPKSAQQQDVILRMADKASNGKELLLVMRAAVGVFPPVADTGQSGLESQVRSRVTAKMLKVATLGQLIEYEARYTIDPQSARPLVERMLRLAADNPDPRTWYRIRLAASHLKASDLEQQAQAKADRLASR